MNRLLVFKLTIQSSYLDNVELDERGDRFDTIQWWFAASEVWRIRTFAMDGDIHVHHFSGEVKEALAFNTTMKNYEDVVDRTFTVDFDNLHDESDVARAMARFGGSGALEIARDGSPFAFWNPSRISFECKSSPE